MNAILFTAVVALAVASAQALFVIGTGSCPLVQTESNFDTARYLGDWYEYERFPAIFEAGLSCVKATYGDNGDGTVSVTNNGLTRFSLFGRRLINRESNIEGKATIPDPLNPAALSVSFSPAQPPSSSANYFVVDTDYDNYSVVFSCSNILGLNVQFAWILTRDRGVAPSNIADLKATLTGYGINVDNFDLTNQDGCSN